MVKKVMILSKKRKKKQLSWNNKFVIIGIEILILPMFINVLLNFKNQDLIGTFELTVEETDQKEIDEALKKAQEYNSMLYQTDGGMISLGNNLEMFTNRYYQSLLNINDTGMMGVVEIPKINVDLPIYHGTDSDALSKGVGHIEMSSLPVGGANSRALLSAHTGAMSQLFSRLDELEVGDLFFISVLDCKLAYQVRDIMTILPDEVEKLQIEPEQDLVSLITCTPYGINTHRLIVTGERVEYSLSEHETIQVRPVSKVQLIIILIIIFLILYIINNIRKDRSHEKRNTKKA